MPIILKALRAQEKASSLGFDWDSIHSVKSKLEEEIDELNIEINKTDKQKIEDEFGDVMFTLINYSRFLKIDAENSLKKSTNKFIGRFKILEKIVKRKKQKINQLNTTDLNMLWNESKKIYDSNEIV